MNAPSDMTRAFEENGYVVIDSGLPASILDGAVADLRGYWDRWLREQRPGENESRIPDAWRFSPNVRAVALAPPVLGVVRALYGREPRPFQTLNFPRGTEQKAHADSIHFNSEPFGMMCGAWVALEDIGPDQGPLVYYPGSHLLPEMNFEEFGIDPDYEHYFDYEEAIAKLIDDERLVPAYGVLAKGQAVIWAANLLHGGAPQNDRTRSRYSQATHYYFDGCRYWRPGHSKGKREYFEPVWVGDETLEKERSVVWRIRRKLGRIFGAR